MPLLTTIEQTCGMAQQSGNVPVNRAAAMLTGQGTRARETSLAQDIILKGSNQRNPFYQQVPYGILQTWNINPDALKPVAVSRAVERRTTGPEALRQIGTEIEDVNKSVYEGMRMTTLDPMDHRFQLQAQEVSGVGAEDGVVPHVGRVLLGPEYFDYAQRKVNQQAYDDYIMFILNNIQNSDVPNREWYKKMFPDIYAMFVARMKERQRLRNEMEDIAVRGVQNRQDLYNLYRHWVYDQNLSYSPISTPDNQQPKAQTRQDVYGNISNTDYFMGLREPAAWNTNKT